MLVKDTEIPFAYFYYMATMLYVIDNHYFLLLRKKQHQLKFQHLTRVKLSRYMKVRSVRRQI